MHTHTHTHTLQATGSTTLGGHPSQIEVTVLTARSSSTVRRLMEHSVDSLELEHLKKISVVCLTDPDKLMQHGMLENEEEAEQAPLLHPCSSPSDLSMSKLDK